MKQLVRIVQCVSQSVQFYVASFCDLLNCSAIFFNSYNLSATLLNLLNSSMAIGLLMLPDVNRSRLGDTQKSQKHAQV